jgi:hypothetical protein
VIATAHDLGLLFVLVALAAFCVAVWLAYRQQWIGALVAAVVGVLILYVT